MGKYSKYQQKRQLKPDNPHPVWRGIGCLLMIIVPIMSYALATILVPIVKATGKLPAELYQPIRFPDWVLRTRTLGDVARFLGSLNNLWAMLIFFGISLLVLAGVFSFLYSIVYQQVGPPRYTALDAPPADYKPRGPTR